MSTNPSQAAPGVDRAPNAELVQHWIDGELHSDPGAQLAPVYDPATGEVQREVELASAEFLDAAVASSQCAWQSWRNQALSRRMPIMQRFRARLIERSDEVVAAICSEHGKVPDDALGEVQRGLEIVDLACAAPQMLKGEFSEQVASGIDTYSIRQPLGPCLGVTPFNFPAMVPLWMLPVALACGNSFILKPSERDPSASLLLAEAASEAGLPPGVLNVVQGDAAAVEALIDDPRIAAVSFVGSTTVARAVYARAASQGKRVQALGGAKNHVIVMPDANLEQAADAAVSAAFGSSGQRCMAISVAVAVGPVADPLVDAIDGRVETLAVGSAAEEGAEMGPLVTAAARDRTADYVGRGERAGARLVRDGRQSAVAERSGFFLGPTVFDRVEPQMDIYSDEIFGPVLGVVRVETVGDALELVRVNPYGNGASIYTSDGAVARRFQREVEAGMVGINVPIPVPVGYYSFGGWGDSLFGDTHLYGPEGFRFYTRGKVITSRWPEGTESGRNLAFPQG